MSSHPPGPDSSASDDARGRYRTVFRALGLAVLAVAIGLAVVAGMDFFAAVNDPSFDAQPTKFWMFFVAVPLLGLGGWLLQLGYAGAAATYMAGEYSPALRSASRDLGLRDHASAAGRGVPGGGPYCRHCGTQNDVEARFCDSCGTSMSA